MHAQVRLLLIRAVRLELGAALVERERVAEYANGRVGRGEGEPLGDEADGADSVPKGSEVQSYVRHTKALRE